MQIVCNKDTKRKDIVKLLKHIMIEYDIKNNDIAQKSGQTKGTISNLLSSSVRPDSSMTIDTLAMLCDAIDCDMIINIIRRDNVSI